MRRRDDRGSTTLEFVIAAPVLIMFILFIVGLGRMSLASQRVDAAAYEAARAASLQRAEGAATADGRAAADRVLSDRGMSCSSVDVSVDVSSYQPGGEVRASVTCVTRLADVAMAGFPGSKTFRADAVVPIEQYRAKSSGFTNSDVAAAN